MRPELAVVREGGADEATERRYEEAAAPGEGEQLRGVGQRADIGRDDVGEDQRAAGLQPVAPGLQQRLQFVAREVLEQGIGDDEVERGRRQGLDLLRRDHDDIVLPAELRAQLVTDIRRRLAEIEPAAGSGDAGGIESLAAAMVEDGGLG